MTIAYQTIDVLEAAAADGRRIRAALDACNELLFVAYDRGASDAVIAELEATLDGIQARASVHRRRVQALSRAGRPAAAR